VNDLAILIQFDNFRATNAAVDPRRVAVAADLIAFGRGGAIQEPDVVLVVDVDAGDLLHAPPIGQQFGPERIDFEDGRAVRIHGLHARLLRVAHCRRRPDQNASTDRNPRRLPLHGDLLPSEYPPLPQSR
jgi:hypothetical protein